MKLITKVAILSGLALMSIAGPASAQTRTESHSGTAYSDAEAIALAKRSAEDMVNRINARTIRAVHTITGYGSTSCTPPSSGGVRTCYVDVYIRETSR